MNILGCQITLKRAPRATLAALAARLQDLEDDREELRKQLVRIERKVYRAGDTQVGAVVDPIKPEELAWKRAWRTGEPV